MGIVVFNAFKHHLHTMAQKIMECSQKGESECESIAKDMQRSEGISDVYIGKLSSQEIENEVLCFLTENNLLNMEIYKEYLKSHGDIKRIGHYMCLTLSDSSVFTLRVSDDASGFVHIHPARYSPNTIRVRTNTLKTVIITWFIALCRKVSPIDNLELINEARSRIDLSPIPDIPNPIAELIERFQEYLKKGGLNSIYER